MAKIPLTAPNTPQAKADSAEVSSTDTITLDVLANDLGGRAKSLISVGTETPDADGWVLLESGARIRIVDGEVEYDPNGAFTDVFEGETATDSFTYTIQMGNGKTSSTTVTVTILGEDPVGFTEFNGHFYKYVADLSTYAEAEAAATAAGGYLATITSAQENEFLNNLMNDTGVAPGSWGGWLGGSDADVEGTWEWSTGEPFVYQNWNFGEPNNLGSSGEDYLHMYANNAGTWDGYWNDLIGSAPLRAGYLIEIG